MKSFFLVCCLLIGFLSNAQNLDSLLHQLSKAKEDTNKVNLYNDIAYYHLHSDKGLFKVYNDSVLLLADKLNHEHGKKIAYFNYAEYYYRGRNWDKMLMYAQKSEAIYKKLTGKKSSLDVKHLYADYYRKIGNVDQALKMYIELVGDYQKLGDKSKESKTFSSIGLLLINERRFQEAEQYFLKSALIYNELNDKNREAAAYINLGALNGEQDNFDKALKYTEKALEIHKKLGNIPLIANCESNLGAFYNSIENYKKGLEYVNSAFEVFADQQDTYLMMRLHIQRAVSYTGLKDFSIAINELNAAKKIIDDDVTLKDEIIDVYYQYYKTYQASRNFENALYYFELYSTLNEKNIEIERQNNISELKEQFEANQREEEINLLQEQNNTKDALLKARTYLIFGLSLFVIFIIVGTIFIRKQNKLKQQKETAELEQRALRTQMNPHFIFNALNSIQRMYVEGNTEKANDFMADFAQLMRKVLENSAHSRISFQEEIDTLRLYMELEKLRCKDSFSYSIDIDETISAFDVQTPPLIIQPFVENAIWHGVLSLQDKKGEITVSVRRKSEYELFVTIQDNGIGFNDNEPRKKHASKGIQITEQRIGSKVAIESSQGQGTTVTFILKTT